MRTDTGEVEVATAPDAATLAAETADDTVLAVDTPHKRYAMALPPRTRAATCSGV